MIEFWNTRYKEKTFAYGVKPNEYLKSVVEKLNLSGKILLPAEGEGRNAVYAAKNGFNVTAFDISTAGRDKALQLAGSEKVKINYQVGALNELNFKENSFDVIALVYAHFPSELRKEIHQKLITLLKPGGYIMVEGFSKKHLEYQKVNPEVGGPKDLELLFSKDDLLLDFNTLERISVTEEEIFLAEGLYHQGLGSVIRYIGKRKKK